MGMRMASSKVSRLSRRLLPVLMNHIRMLLRMSSHGAVYGLLRRHRREHSVMPCVRVWSVLVELNLLGGHWIWAFHCNGFGWVVKCFSVLLRSSACCHSQKPQKQDKQSFTVSWLVVVQVGTKKMVWFVQ